MATSRHQAGVKVARQLRTAENVVDEAMAETLRLGAVMLDARRAAGLGATLGQEALDEVLGAVAALNEARARIVSAHGRLTGIAEAENVRWRLEAAPPALQVVA
jgi:hypothetical protein